MSQLKGACIIGQSGGPTSVINASAYGVIRTALDSGCITKVYGAAHGIKGVLDDVLYDMGQEDAKELEYLLYTPSSALGSCRYKLKDSAEDDSDYKRILEIFKKYDVRYFFYNGGNDSMDTCNKISKYMKKVGYECRVMGIPKTIDNDLFGTDHCPGYASAAKYIATSVMEVSRDAHVYDTGMITIIECMGRHAGWLTAASCLARQEDMVAPHLIYLPEVDFSVEQFVSDVKAKLEEYNSIIVVVSEGIHDKDGNYISAQHSKVDEFGHAQLSGTGAYLKSVIEKEIGCKVRALEPSVIQRSAGHISSLTDVEEAFNLGTIAVRAAVSGKSGVFSTLRRISDKPYSVEYSTENVAVVANTEKLVPRSWINPEGNDVTQDMVDYLRPLIEGVVQTPYRNGLPDYIDVRHLDVRKQKYSD